MKNFDKQELTNKELAQVVGGGSFFYEAGRCVGRACRQIGRTISRWF